MITKFNIEKTKKLNKINKILALFYRKPRQTELILNNEIKNILIIDFALMGDMIMDIPFIKTLRRNCPNAVITMVCMTWGAVILGDQGLVDEFIVFDGKNKLSSPKQFLLNNKEIRYTLKKINSKQYDIGFEPKGDLRHILFMRYTNCLRTVTYNYTGGEYLVTDSFSPKSETKHLIDEKLDLLRMCGFNIFEEDTIPQLKITVKYQKVVDEFISENHLTGKTIIGLHPGASNKNKQYQYYPELIHKIEKILFGNFVLIVFEGPGEKEIVDKVEKQAKDDGLLYYRVSRQIKDYVSIVSICDYMICNDSAAGHIAAAYGIPVVVAFGPIKVETALPRGLSKVVGVSHDIECKPCTLPECPLGTEECIKTITIDEMYHAFMSLLST